MFKYIVKGWEDVLNEIKTLNLWLLSIQVGLSYNWVFLPALYENKPQILEKENKKYVLDDSKLIIRWMDVVAMKIR